MTRLLLFAAVVTCSFVGGMIYSDLEWFELLSDPAFYCYPASSHESGEGDAGG